MEAIMFSPELVRMHHLHVLLNIAFLQVSPFLGAACPSPTFTIQKFFLGIVGAHQLKCSIQTSFVLGVMPLYGGW
jgi:hypothetical protein